MVRTVEPSDIPRLAEIHVYGWRYAYRGIVPALVWDDGLLKGFVIHNTSRDDDARQAHEVQAIYVEPAFVREGVGSALLRAAEWAGTDLGRPECKLWVLEGNTRGRSFYEKNGYAPDGERKIIEEWGGTKELRYSKSLAPGKTEV